ncbi:MAG: restriction endonuclease, partial [Candidatus Thermoplasmatota archaeon]|nr:restriction endonuclease [Candidatus Thermoplasmatota archaeon]
YLGKIFEQVCKQFLNSVKSYPKIGRWWYKEDEIDIVALNEKKNKILFGECKWSKNNVTFTLLNELKEKGEKVRWKNEKREEEYALFSKSGFTEDLRQEASESKELRIYSLKDLEKAF